ncbi:AfsR/SARP family transcriptional regulator [Nonomuraea roseoviolacea]|uniref:DNA-binding SARP family transcriptional activator/tetratricopeptide (TPR) repeat protein n=1 Tax=Nonomuraea roseoviolacea subsp. carminata TaxID=160689 RepID=A0ABT1JY02_9ACTN|nr:BTAD domain-containing putative transcriptional regulator [Nonomuraea roseoviolacea]MCP2346633.1 DNA-binding SARP family transcriptional activator/tetratricopeptide (TPR) repeat protein [Nonomuraea roseoviolacea subsp. carminata]
MLIRLLGPVEAERAGQAWPVRPPQVALTLAALAWEAGRVVPVESLLARVWGEAAPPGARRTLQTVIARIRRDVLAESGTVVQRVGGYLLDVDESAVDVRRFRVLAEQATSVPDPAAPLGEALALWRGDPLTGLSGEWAERVRQRLCDERKDALLRWARAMTGRDAAAVVRALAPLAEQYPLDELVAAALIEALHACGRTAEALAHFAHVRRTLDEELGVEPGASLQQTHRTLLRSGAPPEPAGLVPAQLPVGLRCFVGRAAEFDRLAVIACGERPVTATVCAISGPPGVGKSSLALRWAHLNRDRFPDGQLYADLSGVDADDASVVLPRFLSALGVPEARVPSGSEAQIGLYRSLMAGRRVLVVLDDARGAAQVRPLLATAPGCLTLVTSRAELSGLAVTAGAHLLRLDVLPDDDAYHLLVTWLGEARPAAEPEAAALIIRRCGRLPLALAIVAARLAQRPELPLAEAAADLERAAAGLEPFADDDPAVDLRGVFGRSYRDLPAAAAGLFRRLGLHPGPHLPLAAAASLAALPVARARELAVHLDRANLAELRPPARLHLHDLLRVYAAEQGRVAGGRAARSAATLRLLDYYLHSACAANSVCYPHRDDLRPEPPARGVAVERFAGEAEALRWYADEVVALPALLAEAGAAGLDRQAWQLAWAFTEFMQRRGMWEEILRVQAVALDAARRLGDRLAEARCHNSAARAHYRLGRHREAVEHFEQAAARHRDLDEPVLHGHVLLGLCVALSRTDPGEALERALRALALFRSAGDAVGEARALNNSGWLRAEGGAYDEALADCRRAQRLLADLGYAQGEGHAWDSVAHVLCLKGDHEGAVAAFERAAELLRGCDDRHAAAETLVRLGETHLGAGDVAAALDAWKQAADCYDAVGDARAAAVRDRIAVAGG